MTVDMTNTYWNENGKHEEESQKLTSLMPNWGMTDNKYINLFMTISNIYYDVYNNGGCNLIDNYPKKIEEYLVPFADDLKSIRLDVTKNTSMQTVIRNLKSKVKLEAFLDEIILYLQDKDLHFEMPFVFFDNEKEQLSKTEIEGFNKITFGNEEEYSNWINYRMLNWNYKFVE